MAVGERIRMLRQRHKAHGLENPARAETAKLRLPLIQASATLPSSSSSFRKPHEPVPELWTPSHPLKLQPPHQIPPLPFPSAMAMAAVACPLENLTSLSL
jgi:hypothetical protein